MGDMQYEIQKQTEEELMVAVNQSIDYVVDKEELIKALQYDREQYTKGYNDCKIDILVKVKQAKEEIEEYVHCDKYDCINEDMTNWICASEVVAILDKLIESEG